MRRTVGLVALAVAARALYWLSTLDYTPISDAGSYQAIATNFAHGRGFSDVFPQLNLHETAFRPPVFPILLGSLYRVFGTSVGLGRLVSLVIGVAVVLLVERLVTRTGGPTAGLVAGIAVAVYPPLVANDVSILTEGLSLLVLLLVIRSAADGRWPLAGVETGLLVLTRHSAQVLPLVIACLLVFWIGWRRALGYLLVSAAVVVPWIIRNDVQLGSPVLNTANGFNLAAIYSSEAQNSGGFVDPVFDPRFQDIRLLQFDEVKWDRTLRERGLSGLRAHPLAFVRVTGRNTLGYFELRPSDGDSAERLDGRNMTVRRWALPVYYAVTIAGIAGLWLFRRHRVVQLVSLSAVYFSVASVVSVAPPRLRAPFDLACCIGVGLLAGYIQAKRKAQLGSGGAGGPCRASSSSSVRTSSQVNTSRSETSTPARSASM